MTRWRRHFFFQSFNAERKIWSMRTRDKYWHFSRKKNRFQIPPTKSINDRCFTRSRTLLCTQSRVFYETIIVFALYLQHTGTNRKLYPYQSPAGHTIKSHAYYINISVRTRSFQRTEVPLFCLILAAAATAAEEAARGGAREGDAQRARRSRDCAIASHRAPRRLSLTDTQLSVPRRPPRRVNVEGCYSCTSVHHECFLANRNLPGE